MTVSSKTAPPSNDTTRCGRLLIGFIEHQMVHGIADEDLTRRVCQKAVDLAEVDYAQCQTESDKIRVLAAKTTAQAMEETARGTDPAAALDLFQSLVENQCGGPRPLDLGGKTIKHKLPVRENWLRAAAIMLWKNVPKNRDTLAADARKILGINSKKALAKLVDNFDQTNDPAKPTPVGVHCDLVNEIFKATGWTSLKDY